MCVCERERERECKRDRVCVTVRKAEKGGERKGERERDHVVDPPLLRVVHLCHHLDTRVFLRKSVFLPRNTRVF